jgi:hypothetical protein
MSQDSLGVASGTRDFTWKSREEQGDDIRELLGDKKEFTRRPRVLGLQEAPEAEVKPIAQKIHALMEFLA